MSKAIYDKREIKRVADPKTVAELLGYEIKRVGSRYSILCRKHNDVHFNSCFLTYTGFKCYSCGEEGDVIDLTSISLNCDYGDACNFLGKHFNLKPLDDNTPFEEPRKPVLSDDLLMLIGLKPTVEKGLNFNVYNSISKIVNIVDFDDFDMNSLQQGQHYEWWPDINHQSCTDGYYLIKETVSKNPLVMLRDTNEALYRKMIHDKAVEAQYRYEKIEEMIKSSMGGYGWTQDPLYPIYKIISKRIEPSILIQQLKKLQKECKKIAVEYA